MEKLINLIKPLSGILVLILLAYFFPDLAVYFAISSVLFIIGRPVCEFIKKLHIKKLYVNSSIAAILTLIIMFGFISLFVLIVIPLINKEAILLSNIDYDAVWAYFKKPVTMVFDFLSNYNIIRSQEEALSFIEKYLNSLLNWTNFSTVFTSVVSATSTFFVGLFSIIFLTFFLLREPTIINNIFKAVTPDKSIPKMEKILSLTRKMLTRYIFGLITEVITMMILISTSLYIFGIDNALMIGFIGGLMNIIPYLGPLMGCVIGTLLGIISVLSSGLYPELLHHSLVIICSFVGANLIDNFVLQPLIYSKSVSAHPMEIFFVILIGGKIGGILGMIIAIPTYTIIRIIASQFLIGFKFIEKLTQNLNAIQTKKKKIDKKEDIVDNS